MNKLTICIMVALLLVGMNSQMQADGKMRLGVGADVLIPTGDFGDGFSTGFGGSARGEYMLSPMASLMVTTGYYTWSAKDLPSGYDITFSGVPLLAGLKYYFMPDGGTRVYGMGELGLFFGTVDVDISGLGSGSESETKFSFAPGLGVEFPAGSNVSIDLAARYLIISTDPSTSNIGFRAGVAFGI